MSEQQRKWLASMKKKYGSEQAVRDEMVRRQQKSMQNPNKQKGTYIGPLNRMSKEQLREFSRRAHEARRQKKHQVENEV